MAKKFSTIVKQQAKKAIKQEFKKAEARAKYHEMQRLNTDRIKPNTLTYRDFIYGFNPDKPHDSISGVIQNVIFFSIPLLNIYFFTRFFNTIFLKYKINAVSHTQHETVTKPDRRYSTGYRIEASRDVTSWRMDKDFPYLSLTIEDEQYFKKWMKILGIVSAITVMPLIGFIYFGFNGALFSWVQSMSENKRRAKKVPPTQTIDNWEFSSGNTKML